MSRPEEGSGLTPVFLHEPLVRAPKVAVPEESAPGREGARVLHYHMRVKRVCADRRNPKGQCQRRTGRGIGGNRLVPDWSGSGVSSASPARASAVSTRARMADSTRRETLRPVQRKTGQPTLSILATRFAAHAPHASTTTPFPFSPSSPPPPPPASTGRCPPYRSTRSMTLSVKVSQPRFECEPARCGATVREVFRRRTPERASEVRVLRRRVRGVRVRREGQGSFRPATGGPTHAWESRTRGTLL